MNSKEVDSDSALGSFSMILNSNIEVLDNWEAERLNVWWLTSRGKIVVKIAANDLLAPALVHVCVARANFDKQDTLF